MSQIAGVGVTHGPIYNPGTQEVGAFTLKASLDYSERLHTNKPGLSDQSLFCSHCRLSTSE